MVIVLLLFLRVVEMLTMSTIVYYYLAGNSDAFVLYFVFTLILVLFHMEVVKHGTVYKTAPATQCLYRKVFGENTPKGKWRMFTVVGGILHLAPTYLIVRVMAYLTNCPAAHFNMVMQSVFFVTLCFAVGYLLNSRYDKVFRVYNDEVEDKENE